MASTKELKELWVRFACAAASGYKPPDGIEEDELVEDMVEVTTAYADRMLEEYEGFDATGGRKSKPKKGRRRKEDEEEDEDEDEDDEG